MVDGAVEPRDERGLMPLATARALLKRRRVFAKGADLHVGDRHLLEADRRWAALLSLQDAAEFVSVASALRWDHPPRGRQNSAPFDRYGEGILPWLAAALGPDGRFPRLMTCGLPCLLAVGGEEALTLVLRLAQREALGSWLAEHPEGFGLLAARAAAGDAKADEALRRAAAADPGAATAALGPAVVAARGLPGLDPAVQALLDAHPPLALPAGRSLSMAAVSAMVRNFELPMWDNANSFTGAVRVSGFAGPGYDALVFQSLETGLGMGNVRRCLLRASAEGVRRLREEELVPESALYRLEGDALCCVPTGVCRSRDGLYSPATGPGSVWVPAVGAAVPCAVDTRGLSPAVAHHFQGRSPEEGLLVRLGQDHAEALFLRGAALGEAAGLDPAAVELFCFDAWQTPLAGEAATAAPDLVAIVEALRQRRPLRRLPVGGHPLGNLYDRWQRPALAWGDPRFSGEDAAPQPA